MLICLLSAFPVFIWVSASPGYGFVDFDSPAAAQKAVTALKTSGVQAQMAKVSTWLRSSSTPHPHRHPPTPLPLHE